MKTLLLILVCFLFAACRSSQPTVEASPVPAPSPSPKVIVVEKWVYPGDTTCELKLAKTITSLPGDIALVTQRSNLNRYDAINSHRPWRIKANLELFEFGSDLIDPGKEGQIYFSVAAPAPNENAFYFNKTWEDPAQAMSEIAYEGISLDDRVYRSDVFKINFDNNSYLNLTENSPSFYNAGAFPYLDGILFTAIIGGEGRTYSVNGTGSEIKPFIQTPGYAYGMALSPDGTKYAFHSEYKVYIGDMASKIETQVKTPCAFNFGPKWSPDSQLIVFKCGSDNDHPDIWAARRDGSDVHFLNGLGGYSSAVPFMEGYDFHGGGSDRITVTKDGPIHGKKIGSSVELVLSKFDGTQIQLTHTSETQNTYPQVSPDGLWLLFNSKISTGPMNLMLMSLSDFSTQQITAMDQHCNTRMAYWMSSAF